MYTATRKNMTKAGQNTRQRRRHGNLKTKTRQRKEYAKEVIKQAAKKCTWQRDTPLAATTEAITTAQLCDVSSNGHTSKN
jgi:hypothetical protein